MGRHDYRIEPDGTLSRKTHPPMVKKKATNRRRNKAARKARKAARK